MSTPPSPLATPQPWDLVAADYTAEVMPGFARYAARALELAQLPLRADIVDVACGPGTLALLAAPRVNRVAALDFSPQMIERLRGDVGYAQLGNIEAVVGDGQELPYADAEFDAGFSMFGLMFFPDRIKGLRELRRVVKPAGTTVVSSWLPLANVPAMEAIFGAMRAATPGPPPPPFVPPLGDEAGIRREYAEAGFTAVDAQRVSFDVEYPSTAAMYASMERTLAPMVLMRERMGPEAWPAVGEKIRGALEAAVGQGPQVMSMPAWLTVARV